MGVYSISVASLVILNLVCGRCISGEKVFACDSHVYCQGELLDHVQRARIFPDSKTFVDMNMKNDPDTILRSFQEVLNRSSNHPSKEVLKEFVQQHFEGPGTELDVWSPTDYKRLPAFLNKIKDPLLRDFGWDLCYTWKDLGRKINAKVLQHPERYSLLYVPNPFIVPGGRFRETYYWDSYWVIKGLLLCEMYQTVKGMLENFAFLVQEYGLIPNGGRVYYTRRSQPPLFIPMVDEYYEATKDLEFIRNISDAMEKEYEFWGSNRSVTVEKRGKTYSLNHYSSPVNQPRPESYAEDVAIAENYRNDSMKLQSHLTSACESGWDFSSRWFLRDGDSIDLNTTKTREIVPVDLNSFLFKNEKILSKFFELLGNTNKAASYDRAASERKTAVENAFWSEDKGMWQDFSFITQSSRDYFFPSNVFPLFAECVDDKASKIEGVLKYLESMDILNYDGGIPTSLLVSNQQWDFPNGWPPLQHLFIVALENSESEKARTIAKTIAQKWISSNWMGWNRTRNMFEKYSVVKPGSRGGGGEYDVQEGFGWTNGVILDLLNKYGDSLVVASNDVITNCTATNGSDVFVTFTSILIITTIVVIVQLFVMY